MLILFGFGMIVLAIFSLAWPLAFLGIVLVVMGLLYNTHDKAQASIPDEGRGNALLGMLVALFVGVLTFYLLAAGLSGGG